MWDQRQRASLLLGRQRERGARDRKLDYADRDTDGGSRRPELDATLADVRYRCGRWIVVLGCRSHGSRVLARRTVTASGDSSLNVAAEGDDRRTTHEKSIAGDMRGIGITEPTQPVG